MKKAFIITSVIDANNTFPLTYSNTRTFFEAAERLRQTAFTIASIDGVRDSDITIFLLDASDNFEHLKITLGYQKNMKFISVKTEFPEIFEKTRTHANKSHCESLMLTSFIERYKKELEEFDLIFKLSGRYFIDSSFTKDQFTEISKSKIFFKKPLKFDWNENWPYEMVDRRSIQGDNKLYQYSSVFYGFGKNYLDKILDLYRVITVFTENPQGLVYDVETLLYFFTREFESDIVETAWTVYGWDGTSGTFLRY